MLQEIVGSILHAQVNRVNITIDLSWTFCLDGFTSAQRRLDGSKIAHIRMIGRLAIREHDNNLLSIRFCELRIVLNTLEQKLGEIDARVNKSGSSEGNSAIERRHKSIRIRNRIELHHHMR